MALRLSCVVLIAGLVLGATGCGSGSRASLDLHKADWGDVALPGSVCGARSPIHLDHGEAVIASARWLPLRRVHVDSGWSRPTYGDLDGDGHEEAALVTDCNNGGGTAGGVLAYAQVVFAAVGNSLLVVGVVT